MKWHIDRNQFKQEISVDPGQRDLQRVGPNDWPPASIDSSHADRLDFDGGSRDSAMKHRRALRLPSRCPDAKIGKFVTAATAVPALS
jgi:hypothetical protein